MFLAIITVLVKDMNPADIRHGMAGQGKTALSI
jgi:hypothetical protein